MIRECGNWFNSILCSYNCCVDIYGQEGCCVLTPTNEKSLYVLNQVPIEAIYAPIAGLILFVFFILIICLCIDFTANEEAKLNELNNRNNNSRKFNGVNSVYKLEPAIIVNSNQPEIILVEKGTVNGGNGLSVIKEYNPSPHMMLDLYSNSYFRNMDQLNRPTTSRNFASAPPPPPPPPYYYNN